MKLKLTQKQNQEIISVSLDDTSLTNLLEADQKNIHHSLSWLDAALLPWQASPRKITYIYNLFLKDSDIPVHLSQDGVFFFFGPEGQELVLNKEEFNWADSHPGAYHEEILKDLNYRALEIELLD